MRTAELAFVVMLSGYYGFLFFFFLSCEETEFCFV